jgi:hypothetical protein
MLAWLDIYRREDDDERGKVAMTIEIEGACNNPHYFVHATCPLHYSKSRINSFVQLLDILLDSEKGSTYN